MTNTLPTVDNRDSTRPSAAMAARCVAACVVVFLHFGPYLSMLMRAETRRLRMWTHGDTVELFAGILLLSAVAVGINEILRILRWSRALLFYQHLFVVALAGGVLTNLWYHTVRPVGYHIGQIDTEVRTMWFVVMALVGFSLARPQWGLLRWSRRAALVLSPTVCVVAVQLLSQPSYPQRLERIAFDDDAAEQVAQAAPAGHPVLLMILDGWSYERSFENGMPGPLMPNLRSLSEQAVVFTNARSPGPCTEQSMPRLLMQTDLPVRWGDARVDFETGADIVAPGRFKSIFSEVGEGYTTCAIGYYMPYRLLLGDQVDLCRVYHWPLYNRGDNMVFNIGRDLWAAMMYWTDPWCGLVYRKCRRPLLDAMALRTYAAMKADLFEVIEHGPQEQFTLFHYPMPHDPYLLDEQGVYRGSRVRAGWVDHSDWAGYRRNLMCADRLIGEVIAVLENSGRFEDALIIITSDHTWVYDEMIGDGPLNHVPLVVKMPGQGQAVAVSAPFETVRLGQLIARAHRFRSASGDIETLLTSIVNDAGDDARISGQVSLVTSPTGE